MKLRIGWHNIMNNYTFYKENYTFIRIPKNKARAAYNNGLTVVFTPCKLQPFNVWGLSMDINKHNINCNNIDFNKLCNEYKYYNCNNGAGEYIAFYIPVKNGCYDYNYIE